MRGYRRGLHTGVLIGIGIAICGCASTDRLPAPAPRLSTAVPVGFDGEVRFAFDSEDAFRRHSEKTFARISAAAGAGPINILSLSGGGAAGAFGAGALVGWTRSGHRPIFQLVTGVSVGALIAPLAYLGSDWDPVLTRALASDSSRDLLQRHLLGALFGSSVYSGQPLRHLVEQFVTDELMSAVVRAYAQGRMLFIETTDLDKGEPVIWDMGAIATRGGAEARQLFIKVLVASASIPVVFPPVMIRVRENGRTYDEMHVDGATTVPLFIGPEVSSLITHAAVNLANYHAYALVNGQLGRFPSTTPQKTMSILARGFDTNLTHGIRAALAIAYNFADRYGMQFQVTSVPSGYPFGGPLDFEPAHMHALFDYAAQCAQSGLLWKSLDVMYHEAMTAKAPEPAAARACPVLAAPLPPAAGSPSR